MDTVEKQELATRTRERSVLSRFPLDYGGVMAPLVSMEADLDTLAGAGIENFMAISDDTWGIKEQQRDRGIEVSQQEVDQDVAIAEAKLATGRAKIAIERAADEYTLAARVYDAKVKGLIMGAKEYAALVEQVQLMVDEERAGLAVDKEALRLAEVTAKIYLQTIEQAQVEADIAKAQVEVAKAHVRAAMAGIEAGEAEIKLIVAQTEVYVAEAEKATLQADVANIFAEILTKQLSETKLGVGRAEIAAAYTYIQSKLDDTLALYETKGLIEALRTESEVARNEETALYLAVEKAAADLKTLQEQYARLAFTHEEAATVANLAEEESLRNALVAARKALNKARTDVFVAKESAQNNAAAMVSGAQISARDKEHTSWSWVNSIEHISG
jgi:hypothetical protein